MYIPEANKQLFSLIATGQCRSMSQTMNKGTTISLNGKPYIVGLPKSGRLHSFDMELVKNKNEIPWAIITTISDYTLWHRRMGHAYQCVIKHLRKKHRMWSSPNHRCTSRSLWGMRKRKVQETPFPCFEIEGNTTTQFGSFRSGRNASSLHWQIQIYCHLLRWLFILWGYVLPQKEEWWICCIQTI